jgi:uncharacterized membrane protein
MIYRMTAALLSLAGLFLSAYLYLYKIGKIGTLACGTGGCETVQLSSWSRFAGVEVSLLGIIGYAVLLVLSLTSLQAGYGPQRWPLKLMLLLTAVGFLFTAYLTYLEVFVIHAICRWCLGSAVIITGILLVTLLDRRHLLRSMDR